MSIDNKLKHMHLVTVVWGELHRALFTDVALPTLLSPNNLPALAGKTRLTYKIFTTHYDAIKIRNSLPFKRLNEIVDVTIVQHDDFFERDVFSEHHHFQYQEQCWAREHEAFMVSVVPDIVWGDGCFSHLRKLFEQGKRAVYLKCMRVNCETFVPDFLSSVEQDYNGVMSIGGRDLVKLMLRHLHPLILSQFEDAQEFSNFAELLLWPVREAGSVEGLLVGVPFPSDFLFFFPAAHFQVNESQVLSESMDFDEIAFIMDSDEMVIASPTPMYSYNDWFLERHSMDAIDLARTSLDFGTDFTPEVSRHKMRIHTGKCDDSSWKEVEAHANFVMHKIMTLRGYLCLWRACRSQGLTRVSYILSTLMHRIPRLPTIGRNSLATIFLPVDEAFGEEEKFVQLLTLPSLQQMRSRLMDYVVPDLFYLEDIKSGCSSLKTFSNNTLSVSSTKDGIHLDGCRIIHGDIEVGSFLLHVIEGTLPSSPLSLLMGGEDAN